MARMKQSGYKTGYSKYKELYRAQEIKVKDKYTMSQMLSKEDYNDTLLALKYQTKLKKDIGILSENTSVNFNRLILNRDIYNKTAHQAQAMKEGLGKYLIDRNITNIKLKDIRLKDLRVKGLKDDKLNELLQSFWDDVATAYSQGMDKREIGMTFFNSL